MNAFTGWLSLALGAVAIAAFLALFGCAHAHAESGTLREDMTQQQVQQSIGRAPDEVEQRECGAHLGSPWPCQIWVYDTTNGKTLALTFRNENGEWLLNSWSTRFR
jgi:hypothetical protein